MCGKIPSLAITQQMLADILRSTKHTYFFCMRGILSNEREVVTGDPPWSTMVKIYLLFFLARQSFLDAFPKGPNDLIEVPATCVNNRDTHMSMAKILVSALTIRKRGVVQTRCGNTCLSNFLSLV